MITNVGCFFPQLPFSIRRNIFCLCGKCVTICHARSTQYARRNGRDIEFTTLFNEPGKTGVPSRINNMLKRYDFVPTL